MSCKLSSTKDQQPKEIQNVLTCNNDFDRVGLSSGRLASEGVGVLGLDVVKAHPVLPVAIAVAHVPACKHRGLSVGLF